MVTIPYMEGTGLVESNGPLGKATVYKHDSCSNNKNTYTKNDWENKEFGLPCKSWVRGQKIVSFD